MAGIDSLTRLLLHCDGANDSTSFSDSSFRGHTVTAQGGAKVSTAQSKFGGASLYLDGTGDYLDVDDHADWYPNLDDITIDFWARFVSTSGARGLVSQYADANNWWALLYNPTAGGLVFYVRSAGSATINFTATWSPSTNTWYHIALERWGDTWTIYVNGSSVGTTEDSDPIPDIASPLRVGRYTVSGTNYDFSGYIDEFRVSRTSRYDGENFTPPTAAYSEPRRSDAVIIHQGRRPAPTRRAQIVRPPYLYPHRAFSTKASAKLAPTIFRGRRPQPTRRTQIVRPLDLFSHVDFSTKAAAKLSPIVFRGRRPDPTRRTQIVHPHMASFLRYEVSLPFRWRVFSAAEYRFYRKLDSIPAPGVDAHFATSATLPHTPTETWADGVWWTCVTHFNGALESRPLPIGPNGETAIRLEIVAGSAAGRPPSDPVSVDLAPLTGGAVRATALYLPWADDDLDGRASEWAVSYAVGSDPSQAAPDHTETMSFGGGMARLSYDLPAFAHNADVRVLLSARRNDGSAEVPVWTYSATDTPATIAADAEGPAAPAVLSAWPGLIPEDI